MDGTVGGRYLLLDLWRIVAAAGGLLIGLTFLRIVVMRWGQDGTDVGRLLTWLSHAAFALGASLFALLRLGNPPLSIALLALQSVAIVAGVLGASRELGIPPWLARLLRHRTDGSVSDH